MVQKAPSPGRRADIEVVVSEPQVTVPVATADPRAPVAGDEVDVAYGAFRRRRMFPAVDGLRALAILGVIWHHVNGASAGHSLLKGHLRPSLFFVLSGYLISTQLLRERSEKGVIDLARFYIKRILRIFPLYYLILAIYVASVLAFERGTPEGIHFFENLPAFLTFTINWFVDLTGGRVFFYFVWSLATQEQFYFTWPVVLALYKKSWVPVAVILGTLAIDNFSELGVKYGLLDRSALPVRIATSLATPIMLGCLAAVVLHNPKGYRMLRPVTESWWAPLLALAALVVTYEVDAIPEFWVYVSLTWTVVAFAMQSEGWATRLLANRFARHLGNVSFGLYMMHMLCVNIARKLVHHDDGVLVFVVGVVLTIIAATLSHRYFEMPIARWDKPLSWWQARKATPAAHP
jgi:peptidoglycan/LPS O-acetylase OafA/YrhL